MLGRSTLVFSFHQVADVLIIVLHAAGTRRLQLNLILGLLLLPHEVILYSDYFLVRGEGLLAKVDFIFL